MFQPVWLFDSATPVYGTSIGVYDGFENSVGVFTSALGCNFTCQLRRSGRRVILIGSESSFADFKNESLARAIMKAYQCVHMLETGKFGTVLELAQALKTNRSAIARTLALVNLAPDIVTAVFSGTAPETLPIAKLVKGFPEDWHEQRIAFGMA